MQISDHVYLVGSEQFGLSHPLDSSCYLLDGGSALGLVDSGLGLGVDDILANVKACGFDSKKISHLLITHAHVGHWGGAGLLREKTGAEVWAPAEQQNYMIHPNEEPGIRLNYKFGRYPPGFQVQACPPDHTFNDSDRVVIGNLELQMLFRARPHEGFDVLFLQGRHQTCAPYRRRSLLRWTARNPKLGRFQLR